jgi:hypothetical integral membrane protein (TIGR02206 family)
MSAQNTFQLFGSVHLTTLALIVAIALVLPLLVRRRWPDSARTVGLGLAVLLVAQEGAQITLVLLTQGVTVALLPLHLCTLTVYLTALMLLTRAQRLYEVVYFWGLGGTTQALLTPELMRGFPAPEYLLFFIGHGLVIVGVLYGALVYRLRPHPMSIVRVGAITLALAAVIVVVNLWLGTNFMYLMAKPERASLMDWLGPWPWYWLPLIGIGLLTFLILYLPFYIRDRLTSQQPQGR